MGDSEKYKRLIESLENEYFFYSHTLDGKYLYISPSIEKVLGYTVEEAYDGIVKHMTESELNNKAIETLKKSASGKKQKTFEFELFTKDQQIKIIEITESPLFNDSGEVVSIEGVAHDITERKNFEKIITEQNTELTNQKEELQATLENLQETQAQLVQSEKMVALGNLIAGIAHEINTPIGAINASTSNITSSLDSSMNNLYTLITKLSKKELVIFLRIMKMVERNVPALTSKEKRQYKKSIQTKLKDTPVIDVYATTDVLMYLNLYDKIDDILPLLEVENPDFILKAIKDIFSVRKNTDNIRLAVEKASKIVFALKKFVHKDHSGVKEKTDLKDTIETVLTLQHNELKQGIEVIREYEPVPKIECYPDELVQVWINVISNAIHAMNNKGKLVISIQKAEETIKVSITDNGPGIPKEIKNKIFDPFFTTKKSGEGTGIGLDIVKRIIDKHDGEIKLESELGIGTSFHFLLPVK